MCATTVWHMPVPYTMPPDRKGGPLGWGHTGNEIQMWRLFDFNEWGGLRMNIIIDGVSYLNFECQETFTRLFLKI